MIIYSNQSFPFPIWQVHIRYWGCIVECELPPPHEISSYENITAPQLRIQGVTFKHLRTLVIIITAQAKVLSL